MSEWFKVTEKLPKDGEYVSIRVGRKENVVHNVPFINGRFWKQHYADNSGIPWRAIEWSYPEKAKKTKSSPEDVTLSDDVHTAIDSEGYGDG